MQRLKFRFTSPCMEEDGLNELYKPPKPTLLMLFIMQHLGWPWESWANFKGKAEKHHVRH